MTFQKIITLSSNKNANCSNAVIASGRKFLVLDCSNKNTVIAGPTDILQILPEPMSSNSSYISIPDSSYPDGDIIDLASNIDSSLIACCANDKSITIWSTKTWTITCKRHALKRLSVCKFSQDSSCVLIGDKFGDIYRFCLTDNDSSPTLLGGHVSMLTDMVLAPNYEYLISADRDEKIRVHNYPNTYNLETFCLGHKQFVSKLVIPSFAPNLLISGGGDEELLIWNYATGTLLYKTDLHNVIKDVPTLEETETPEVFLNVVSVTLICVDEAKKEMAVLLEGRPCIIIIDATEINSHLLIKKVILTINNTTRYNPLDASYDSTSKLWTVGYIHFISEPNTIENACQVYDTSGDTSSPSNDNILAWWQSSSNETAFDMFFVGKLRKRWFEERNQLNKKQNDGCNDRSSYNHRLKKRDNAKKSKQNNLKQDTQGDDISQSPQLLHKTY